jgi:hypothetical protein
MSKHVVARGEQYSRLTVVRKYGRRSYDGRQLWQCRCVCGATTYTTAWNLTIGHTKSCGCLKGDSLAIVSTTHGESHTRLYRIWTAMLRRCNNPNSTNFFRYGEQGAKVCKKWHLFVAFRDWSMANGYQDHLTIDRWPNRYGDYKPSNCRWATYKEQALNTSQSRAVIRSDGERFLCMADGGRASGTNASKIARAIKRNGTSGGFGWRYDDDTQRQRQRPHRGGHARRRAT